MKNKNLPEHVSALLERYNRIEGNRAASLLQTHISWVLLAGNHAYKIKKPVDFGFLDFTTLKKRRQACMDELGLNRRLAPDIYLDVLPVCKDGDGYRIGETGEHDGIIDYCLKMLRFDQQNLFDRLVSDNRFNPEWMDQLARTIAEFHQRAESGANTDRFGEPQFLMQHIRESLSTGENHLKETMPANLRELSSNRFEASRPALIGRLQHHHIRDCHGDLHLKNIVLYNNVPTPFDCIEFNDEFRMIDTMNDAAFLVMDCDARKRSDLGYRFLSRYLEQSGDYDGLLPLPLYLSYRAGVRGKVACLLSDEPSLSEQEKQNQLIEAADYFRLAEEYLTPAPPKLIAIGGLSGSGKSHLALLGLHHEKAIIIRSDATRKRIAAGHPELQLYGKPMHELTYCTMFEAAEVALKAGFTVILDATFLHPASRMQAATLAQQERVPLTFLWIDTDTNLLKERVRSRSRLNNDISDADLQVLEKQLETYERPDEAFITFIGGSGAWPL